MNTILFLIIALVTVLIFVVVYKQLEGKKRYTNALYLQSLGRIAIFFEFNEVFHDFDAYIAKEYFDNVEGKMLDDQQRTALITDEYSNLILAGAGSPGKRYRHANIKVEMRTFEYCGKS